MTQQTQNRKFKGGSWLDPCSGIGNLSWHLVNAQFDKEDFLKTKLTLSDRDDLALEIARVLFTLSFQNKYPNLYHEIANRFVKFDFLSVADNGNPALISEPEISKIPEHDFVIVNPPYLGLKADDPRFETSKARDLYAYFLENVIKTSSGFVSITPQSFTNAQKFQPLRRLILGKYKSIRIYSFDNIPGNIFYGVKFGSENSNKANSIRAAITIAHTNKGAIETTSLMRWKTSEREQMFKSLDKFLTPGDLSEDYFPKVSAIFSHLFFEMKSQRKLGELVSSKKSQYALYIPAAPRYFISALKRPVARTSMKTIHFANQEDLDTAYLALNSSLMYWWWRVRDGGMTLSLESITSLPLPQFVVDPNLVRDLEKSEKSNVVTKRNAGALHENVKHDLALVQRLNELIVPSFADRLLLTHGNSELIQLN
jgi:hypothetical protein